MKVTDMKSELYQIVSDVFEMQNSEVDETLNKDTFSKWDSIMHLVLIAEIEHHFNITFSPDSIGEIHSVQDILDKLKQHMLA